MADVILSSAVRNNLLSLQSTADLLGKTQNRLATGLKVNSALDDPTSFFTASSLNSRAGDLNRLLDSLSNGVQTLEAADDGLSAITKTVESLQATVNQARQDASFKSTSFTVDTGTIGTTTSKNLTFAGGSVGTTPVNIALNQAGSGDGTQTTVTAAGYAAPTAAQQALYDAGAGADAPADGYVGDQTIAITFGGDTANVIVEDANNTLADIINAINADIATSNLNGVVQAYDNAGAVGLRTISNVDGAITVTGGGEATIFGTQTTQTGSDGVHTFAVNGTSVTLNATTGADVATSAISINAQLGTSHAFEAYDAGGGALGIRAKANGATALSITGSSASLFGAVTLGTPDTTPGSVKTVDELVSTINASSSLSEKVRASNDNGKLRLENLSTETLTVTGAAVTTIDGSSSNVTIEGNDVRKNLINQFNEIRTKLDQLSDDASFNGINLLRGDKLKLNFNESGSSNIEIQAKDSSGNVRAINTTNLSIDLADSEEFSSNTSLDARREALGTALTTLRSQASQFGSNLSIVETRQDFTKNLITTLETGAANLTLADTNEEGANLLALQTRQQLSSVALSLAAQSDQNVLRLF